MHEGQLMAVSNSDLRALLRQFTAAPGIPTRLGLEQTTSEKLFVCLYLVAIVIVFSRCYLVG